MEELGKRWVSNHQRKDFPTMKQCIKRQKLNDEVTSRLVKSGIRSMNGIKRKLTFANDRNPKTMGLQPSKNGLSHHETMQKQTKPEKRSNS